jgi:uncharacterized protein (TIGR03086 family)
MTVRPAAGPGPPRDAVALLERAVGYTLGSLHVVTPAALSRPTPCREWNLHALLRHMDDSLAALQEAADLERVTLEPHMTLETRDGPGIGTTGAAGAAGVPARRTIGDPTAGAAGDPTASGPTAGDTALGLVAGLRSRACRLVGAWIRAAEHGVVRVGDAPLGSGVVSLTGALEIAVHGWDVAQACGRPRPIPPPLAAELLELAPLVVTTADRPARFAAPLDPPATATPGDRLLAFLGRTPDGQDRR